MKGLGIVTVKIALLLLILAAGGCIERKLTVTTEPPGAVVWLNDEEIGATPVSVNFKWYGDYKVRIQKGGFEILDTHRELEPPFYDAFPMDFFATLWPDTIRHEAAWHFDLAPAVLLTNEQLLQQAQSFSEQVDGELLHARREIQEALED